MNHLRFISRVACVVALTIFGASFANAQTTTIVNDSFADGITNMGPNQIGFISLSSGAALDANQAPGPLDFATGDQGRQIGGLFAPQTLINFGDQLDLTFDFTTPATISFDNGGVSTNEDFRFGLFDSSTATGTDSNTMAAFDFTQNIGISGNSSSGNQPGTDTIAGFVGEVDNINAGGTDLGIRTHDIFGTALGGGAPVGSFLNTTTGFDQTAGGLDDVTSFAPNEDYVGTISVAFSDASLTALDVTVGISGIGTDGLAFTDTLTDTILIADDAANAAGFGAQVGVNTTTFDLFTISATTGAFGGTEQAGVPGGSSVGDPNNGIDISNVTINFTSTVPEPGSAMFLLSGLAGLGFVRRRK